MASGFPDWLRAFVMMAHDGTAYRPVLVDDLGHLYALLQGMTPEDELRTVRLDDEGRMSAFIIDSVDAWGNMLSIGNAELAARLGSPTRFDRRGQVREMADFESGLANVVLSNDPLGTTSGLSPVVSLFGGYSLRVDLAANVNAWSLVALNIPADIASVHGVEVAFATDTSDIEVEMRLDRWTGTRVQRMSIVFDAKTEVLKITDTDGGTPTFAAGVEITATANLFHMMKMVADLNDGAYYRFLFNGKVYDVSDYGPYCADSNFTPYTRCWIYVRNGVAAVRTVYIDNIILTVAEPE